MRGGLTVRVGPSDVGKRVSLRTLTEPGDPAGRFTDTVGVLTAWTEGALEVTRRDGSAVRLRESALVAGKVVPDTPARRRGLPAADVPELTAVAARAWPAAATERIGDWLVRAAGGWTRRANSACALGDTPPDLARVSAWYAARGLPPAFQLATGQELLAADLERRGWAASGHAVVQIAALAPLADREPVERVRVEGELTAAWLSGWPRAADAPGTAERVLAGGRTTLFALAPGAGARPAAVGRCVVDGRWAGFTAVRVDPAHRGTGLAREVMAALARAALDAGASAAHLQVETDNAAARTLYRSLGFADHHHYHYRSPAGADGR
ncbi:GNAT family N-acetyltransferase [Streptomyces sp. DSM 41886]|uniref:GNAT family N-acetyltransferase n=1 Tax=Streptomyces johnsoniae TaxID=3075532 RepID=A0ABU2S2D0_9ACTN|nr:GNAT family N-acetyltransferase [Streptomyces sp. DSM 41886]MDT0443158.1 GNAT family N-acetyltransferase [Streptomyces sp. DSM 41886]